ncbi:MAG: AmmeMemoRadiSam system protein B [Candidatus Margulisiibacteriota bacterium]
MTNCQLFNDEIIPNLPNPNLGIGISDLFRHSGFVIRVLICSIVLILLGSIPATAFFADVRKPAVAGMFYPGTRSELSKQINQFLDNVKYQRVQGKLIALIVPHAGYDYSGQVAAYAYKELEGRQFKRIILIGASHHMQFDGISIGEFDYYETPLGRVKVDRDLAGKIIESSQKISFMREAHLKEHSLEVQLPFLQTVLKKDFKIVPIIFGNASFRNCQILAMSLVKLVDEETLIVCSTDWSHYHDYETATRMDKKGIHAVLKGDIEEFVRLLEAGSCEACGIPAIITTMLVAPSVGANKTQLLKYANSGDVTGDRSRVVGYAAIAYSYESSPLSPKEKAKLLEIAREALEKHLSKKKVPELKIDKGILAERRGAFVTLTKKGRLRGCIGYIKPVKPLAEAVQEMAIAAATRDMRFQPVTRNELKEIEIEISVLSKLQKVENINEIKIGRDGLYIVKGWRTGLLLPQVAVEWGWNRKQFLEQVCQKAGLPKHAWKDKETVLYRFSAEIFQE